MSKEVSTGDDFSDAEVIGDSSSEDDAAQANEDANEVVSIGDTDSEEDAIEENEADGAFLLPTRPEVCKLPAVNLVWVESVSEHTLLWLACCVGPRAALD